MQTLSLAFIFLLCLLTVHAGILEYENRLLRPGRGRSERVTMFSKNDSPVGNADPYADFRLTLTDDMGRGGHLEYLFLLVKHRDRFGYKGGYCCTSMMIKAGHCKDLGKLVVKLDPPLPRDEFDYESIALNGSSPVEFHRHYVVDRSGLYYLYMINCGGDTNEVTLNAVTEWRNPYGYLEAAEFGFIPFYISLMVMYIILLVVWMVPVIKYRDRLVVFQKYITGIIVLGCIAAGFALADLFDYNITGHLSLPLVVSASTLDTLKRTLGRVLLIIVSMGYRVTTDKMSKLTVVGVTLYGILYYFVSATDEIIDDLQARTLYPINMQFAFFALLPVIALDAVFYAWVFTGLVFTIKNLDDQGQSHKLQMYKYIWITLLVGMIVSMVVVVLEEVAMGIGSDGLWTFWWMFDSWWQIFSLLIMCVIAWIWRPRADNDRYVYSQVGLSPEEADKYMDEESTEMQVIDNENPASVPEASSPDFQTVEDGDEKEY